MLLGEKVASEIRNLPILCKFNWFWNLCRPIYRLALKVFYRKGLLRNLNGIGEIYVSSECLPIELPPAYELEWWKRLMREIREEDVIVEVGAYIGLLTITMAKKTGNAGKVIAFEPNPRSLALLKKNVKLNAVFEQVECYDAAVSDSSKPVMFTKERSVSRVRFSRTTLKKEKILTVKAIKIDEAFHDKKIDILKIDVEGYEGNVLSGARNLLKSKELCPRFIFIECHPYAWKEFGVSSETMLAQLKDSGYAVYVPELPHNDKLDDVKYNWAMFASKHI